MDDAKKAEYPDTDYEAAFSDWEEAVRNWKEVWMYLEDDLMPSDWVVLLDKTGRIRVYDD